MTRRIRLSTAGATLLLAWALPASAQHEGHTTPAAPSSAQVAACVQSQQQVSTIADQAAERIESARQTNNPAAMRSALDDMEAVLARVKSLAQTCASLQAGAGDQPHAGHAGANVQQSGVPSPAPVMSPGSTSPAPGAVPPPGQVPQMDHAAMGHAMPMTPQPTETTDPVCGMKVDPAKALKITYKGKDYYFCSERDRDLFLKNAEQYLKKGR